MSAKNLSEVFRDAQKYLWDGIESHSESQEFICHAINSVHTDSKLKELALKIIDKAIHPHMTLNNWLYSQGIGYVYYCSNDIIQAHRLQWLKMLEAQFKEA